MQRLKKSRVEIFISSFLVVLPCLLFCNLTYADQPLPYGDTIYFEPVPGTRMSADSDTFYIQPGGEDIKINVNLRNENWIAAAVIPVTDRCHDGSILLDLLKNNGAVTPKCFEGSRVVHWGVKAINLNLYPPQFLLGATAMLAEPLPPGDGPLATLTFTANDSCNMCLDTVFYPAGPILRLIDTNAIDHPPVFIPGYFIINTCPYNPGDLNWDGIVDILDVPLIVYYLFKGWEAPCPIKAADANCDEQVTIADAVYLIRYIFRSGEAPQTCEY